MLRGFLQISCLFLLSYLPSCTSYHWGYGELASSYTTISIPYIEGDQEGELTAEIIKQLTTSGALKYASSEGNLILQIKIIELGDENIGFRYDRKKQGNLRKSLIPTETRQTATVELKLVESLSGKVIRGPALISSSIDFDHDYYSSRNGINIFSLGQLTDIDAAQEAARLPLNRRLATKIVDYTINSW